MAELDCFKLVYILLFTANVIAGLDRYTEHHLEEARICHPLRKKHETLLSNSPNAAVIVRPVHTFQHWQVKVDMLCRFVFKAHKGEHLFAVIQNMSLRGNDTHCLDYIKDLCLRVANWALLIDQYNYTIEHQPGMSIRHVNALSRNPVEIVSTGWFHFKPPSKFKRKDQHKTREFCGQIDRRKVTFRPMQEQRSEWEKEYDEQIRRDFAEFDSEGEIETTIFISKNPLERNQTLDLTIVYTPYKDCSRIKENRDEYRSATNYSVCVWKKYYCDGYQNCIDEICRDEDNCEKSYDIVSNGTGTKVTIGAVTTMLLCFVIFVMGLWMCRRNKKMCWSSDCAGPSVNENRLSRIEREIAGSARQSVAVDPMLEVSTLPSVLDKDLPPSYDSLFPEQSNPSAP